MALEKFRASPLPVPPSDYNQQYMTQLIRVLGLYFSQLDSLTPNQAQSYRADRFIGGQFEGDFTGGSFVGSSVDTTQLTADFADIKEVHAENFQGGSFVGYSAMANKFYGSQFNGFGDGIILPHIAASDSTDQVAGGNDTPTVVEWNTLDSGYGWTLNSPGSATADFPGVYTIRYSLQFVNTANAIHSAVVWLKVNNNDVANSATEFSIPARKSASIPSYVAGYSEVTFEVAVGDEIELYWATDLAGDPTVPTDGVYIFHDVAKTVAGGAPYDRPAIPSAIGSIVFVSAINNPKVAPLGVIGVGGVGSVIVDIA